MEIQRGTSKTGRRKVVVWANPEIAVSCYAVGGTEPETWYLRLPKDRPLMRNDIEALAAALCEALPAAKAVATQRIEEPA